MATKKKSEPDTTYEWELVQELNVYDKRRCGKCGFESEFPKDMQKCIWTECPECGAQMRWDVES